MQCAICHSKQIPGAQICDTCGLPVALDPAFENQYFSRLSAIAPPQFIKKIRSAPYLAKERRMITAILFAIDNDEAFNQVVPENERILILNKALDRFAKHIFSYEGTIAKIWQNSVLAFFGAPISHEDDALRAVHAALTILQEIQDVQKEIQTTYGIPLQVKTVLNTGPIVISNIKSNLRFEFQSLENTLESLATALCTPLPSFEVILLENAYRFTKTYIEFEKLEDHYCENIDATLSLWRLIRISDRFINGQRKPATKEIGFTGRKRELNALIKLSETIIAGLGRIGLVLGDPGIGKSRLIMEWKTKLRISHQSDQIRWIEVQGLVFGRDLGYHLLKNLLRSALNLPVIDTEESLKASLRNTLCEKLDADNQKYDRFLAHLLEIPISDEEEQQIHQLSTVQLHTQYLKAIRSFLQCISIDQPLFIILEDLQWADPSSVQLLGELLSMTATSPILFCLVSRPDIESNGWQLVRKAQEDFGSRLIKIELTNLNDSQSRELIRKWGGNIEPIPPSMREVVLTKSEGNPYFIKVLVEMLKDEELSIDDDRPFPKVPKINPNKIPDSLQGLLTTRVDRLQPDARFTLKIASIIGRNFREKILQHVLSNRAPKINLMEQLSRLESLGMIKIAQIHPELTYQFQHILMYEATYHGILKSDRSELHLAAGLALEELYPDQKEQFASQLAFHFLEGGDLSKAFIYLDLAGHRAKDSYANAEAESYFLRAIQLAKNPDNFAHLSTDLGEVLAQQGKHRDAIQAWEQAIQYHKKLGNTDQMAQIYGWSARSARRNHDNSRILDICREGLQAIKGAVESPAIAYLFHEISRACLFTDQPDQARMFSEKALHIARRLDAFDVQVEALATIGILPDTEPKQAIAALETAIRISEEHKLFKPASRAYINLAAVMNKTGKIRLSREYYKKAIQLGNKVGGLPDEHLIQYSIALASLWLADFDDVEAMNLQVAQTTSENDSFSDMYTLDHLFIKGQLSRFQGNFSIAQKTFTALIDRLRQIQNSEYFIKANIALAEIILERQYFEEKARKPNIETGIASLTGLLKTNIDANGLINASVLSLLSSFYALQGDLDQAEQYMECAQKEHALDPDAQDQVKLIFAQARVEGIKKQYKKAFGHLHEALDLVEKMDGRWWRSRIWLEMGILYLKQNEPEGINLAESLFRESLAEFKQMGVNGYPDLILDKLRRVKSISREQAIAHHKISKELAEAGRVQHTFIPAESPQIEGFDISSILLSAHETSGDFFDFIELEEDKSGIVIADVGDKGVGAALYMAMCRTLIRTYAGEHHLDPSEVIENVNRRILTDTHRGIFLTLVFGVLDPKDSTFTYVNAGHNPPFYLKKTQQGLDIIALEKTGTLVGIFPESTWEVRKININPGEILVLYTDGITEAQDGSGDFYGNKRLIKTLETCFTQPAEQYRNRILANVRSFSGSTPRLDDVTLIVICRNGVV